MYRIKHDTSKMCISWNGSVELVNIFINSYSYCIYREYLKPIFVTFKKRVQLFLGLHGALAPGLSTNTKTQSAESISYKVLQYCTQPTHILPPLNL